MSTPDRSLPGPHWIDVAPDAPADADALRARWVQAAMAVAATMFASRGGPPPAEQLRWLGCRLHGLLDDFDTGARWLFRLSLIAVSWLAPLLVFSLPTFARLRHDRRLQALHRFERSPAGLTLFAVKAILCIAWFEHPETARHAHFDGACLTGSDEPTAAEAHA